MRTPKPTLIPAATDWRTAMLADGMLDSAGDITAHGRAASERIAARYPVAYPRPAAPVRDEQIAGLKIAAEQTGDLETVTLCEHAMLGEAVALRRCILKIASLLSMRQRDAMAVWG